MSLLGITMPFFCHQTNASCLANAGHFLVNEEDLINLLTAPGFLEDFHALPLAAQAEFKRNFEHDSIGILQNGQFRQRLRGTRLTDLQGYECLAGKQKMYLSGSAYRVVFEQSGNAVFAYAAGPRYDMEVYKRARNRITNAYTPR